MQAIPSKIVSTFFFSLILLESIVAASIVFGEKVLYISAALFFIVEFLLISKYRLDLLLYVGLAIFIFTQFHLVIFDLGRWLFLLLSIVVSFCTIRITNLKISPIVAGLGLISLYSIITSMVSYYPAISLLKALSLFLFALFIATVIPAIRVLYPYIGVQDYFLRMYLFFSVIIVLTNAIYVLIMPSPSFVADRFRGWFSNPNGVGAFFGIIVIPVLAYGYTRQKHTLGRLGMIAIFILAIVELIATQSRAGILAGVAGVIVLVLAKTNLRIRPILLLMLVLIFISVVVNDPSDNVIRRFVYRNEETLTGSGRLPVWIATWSRFLQHTFLGSGLGVSDTGLEPVGFALRTGNYIIEKGNSYLGILEELGIAGSLIFLCTLVIPLLSTSWKKFDSNLLPHIRTNQFLSAVIIAGFVNAMFEAWILSVGSLLCFVFWTLVATIYEPDNS